MNSDKQTAIIVGVLFLIGYVTALPANVFLESILNTPDYLINVYPNQTQVILAMLLELTNAAAVVGIAVMLFPILKKHSESIALWYTGFRVIEAAMWIVSAISTLSLITLSQEYIAAGAPDASYFQALGALALAERSGAGQMATMFLFLGGLIFYSLLYQSKLLPRFISVWGLIAVASLFTNIMLAMFGYSQVLILVLPLMSNEIFLAIWLIVKGFNSSTIASADS